MNSITKICARCKERLETCRFTKATKEKDGLQPYCTPCRKEYSRQYREVNKEKEAARHKKYLDENREKRRTWEREYYRANPDKRKIIAARYRDKNLEKERDRVRNYARENSEAHKTRASQWRKKNPEKMKTTEKAYIKANPEKINAKNAKRRALKHQAIPIWANLDAIRSTYLACSEISKKTGLKHHVDHIVPLNSKFVCGLHVENNLQIIPMAENTKKGNRTWPDRPL